MFVVGEESVQKSADSESDVRAKGRFHSNIYAPCVNAKGSGKVSSLFVYSAV